MALNQQSEVEAELAELKRIVLVQEQTIQKILTEQLFMKKWILGKLWCDLAGTDKVDTNQAQGLPSSPTISDIQMLQFYSANDLKNQVSASTTSQSGHVHIPSSSNSENQDSACTVGQLSHVPIASSNISENQDSSTTGQLDHVHIPSSSNSENQDSACTVGQLSHVPIASSNISENQDSSTTGQLDHVHIPSSSNSENQDSASTVGQLSHVPIASSNISENQDSSSTTGQLDHVPIPSSSNSEQSNQISVSLKTSTISSVVALENIADHPIPQNAEESHSRHNSGSSGVEEDISLEKWLITNTPVKVCNDQSPDSSQPNPSISPIVFMNDGNEIAITVSHKIRGKDEQAQSQSEGDVDINIVRKNLDQEYPVHSEIDSLVQATSPKVNLLVTTVKTEIVNEETDNKGQQLPKDIGLSRRALSFRSDDIKPSTSMSSLVPIMPVKRRRTPVPETSLSPSYKSRRIRSPGGPWEGKLYRPARIVSRRMGIHERPGYDSGNDSITEMSVIPRRSSRVQSSTAIEPVTPELPGITETLTYSGSAKSTGTKPSNSKRVKHKSKSPASKK